MVEIETKGISLAKNSLYNVVFKILNVLFPLIITAYISRILAPTAVGKVTYAQNIASYFVMFAALGIPRYGTREIAKAREDDEETNKLFSELLIINGISTAICALAYYVFVGFGVQGNRLIFIICGTEILFNFININWLYEGKEEFKYITGRSFFVKVIMLGATVLLVKEPKDFPIYAFILCLGIGLNNVFNLFYARKMVTFVFNGINIKRHLSPVFVLLLSVITSGLYNKVDITMLGVLCSAESVAYYTNAHKMVNLAIVFVTAVSAVFMPRLSYLFQFAKEEFNRLVTIGTQTVLILAVPCCAGMIVVARNLIMFVFGGLFVPATLCVQIMAVLVVVIGVGDLLCYHLIISTGNEKALIKSRVVAGIVNIVLNALLIPRYQHNGAAFASVVSELIVNGMLLKFSLTIVKPQISKHFITTLLVGTALMSFAVLMIRQIQLANWLSLIISVIIGASIYFVCLILTKNDAMILLLRELKSHKKVRGNT